MAWRQCLPRLSTCAAPHSQPSLVHKGSALCITGMRDATHVVLQSDSSPTPEQYAVLAALPPEISFIAACFTHSLLPGPDQQSQDRLATLRCFLPASEEVVRLKAIFYSTCTYLHDPVPQDDFDLVFSAVYEAPWETSDRDDARVLHVHAVMFMFLALGSAYDTALPANVSALIVHSCLFPMLTSCLKNANAAGYYELACASLAGTRMCAAPTFEAIQAMVNLPQVCSALLFR
jgi:hypothetical protein